VWNERRLVRRAARGDSDAFAAIFRRYQQDLYRYCVTILGDPQDAQDALQNTMVKALAALPGERRQIELKPWLYRVAHNESVELRRRGRPSEPLGEDAPALGASVEQRAADRRRLRDLLADIGELPERQRGALVMRELAGLDFEEIGAALDTSPAAARQVLYEARRGLQQMSEGREMRCDSVTAILSERDGRVARRRDVRAHLRDCPECRRFADAITSRRETLAAISPLPAVAAAAIAKGALSGAVGGGASTGGAGGAAGVAAGAAAKAASTGAILKSAAGIIAVVAVGAVAVDHGHLFHGRGSPAGAAPERATVARDGSGDRGQAGTTAGDAQKDLAEITTANRAGPGVADRGRQSGATLALGRRAQVAGLNGPGARGGSPFAGSQGADGSAHRHAEPPTAGASAPPHGRGASGGAKPQREHPRHPEHPARPEHHEGQAHAPDSTHPSHPEHPARAKGSPHPQDPSHPRQPAHPDTSGAESGAAAETHAAHPEHPSHSATTADESASPEAGKSAEGVEVVAEPDTSGASAEGTSGAGPGHAQK
jgi:RNA polymerase sigma factor (sigma-70 family)